MEVKSFVKENAGVRERAHFSWMSRVMCPNVENPAIQAAQRDAAAALLHVVDRNGDTHGVEAVEGWRLMEIIRDYGLGMDNTCGGALACAECHVVLDPQWAGRVPAPSDEELEKLDGLPMLYEHSRLACQILWSNELAGLRLTIAQET